MKACKIALTRTYLVSIQAENEKLAMGFLEHYLGDCLDLSDEKEQKARKFSSEGLEMVYNEAKEIIAENEN